MTATTTPTTPPPPVRPRLCRPSSANPRSMRCAPSPTRSGKRIRMVNSTAVGGGVAELLNRARPFMRGTRSGYQVGCASPAALPSSPSPRPSTTPLHGAPYDARPWTSIPSSPRTCQHRHQCRSTTSSSSSTIPQPVGLVRARDSLDRHTHWVWRCHIDLSHPNRAVWNFLRQFVSQYDLSPCSPRASFTPPAFHSPISFRALHRSPSDKNRDLAPEYVRSVFCTLRYRSPRPIVTQVSRFDRLKDPVGVIRACRLVKRHCRLPARPCRRWCFRRSRRRCRSGGDPRSRRQRSRRPPPRICRRRSPCEINALQRASTVVVQKTLREGFGLTVAEALWKKKPVVASAVGGIVRQVLHKLTGMLVHSVEGCAYQIRYLLANPEIAQKLARTATNT